LSQKFAIFSTCAKDAGSLKELEHMDQKKILKYLNELLENELAGVVRYTHYAFMVFGHNRIPICAWLREQATESLAHANMIGEYVTSFGGHPSLKIGPLLESNKHKINDILDESLEHERSQVALLRKLLDLVEGNSIVLEEFCRELLVDEENHIFEVEKMIRQSK
jgi:bacterioferritin